MGVSTDGLLWYGVSLGDDDEEIGERISDIVNGPEDSDTYLYGDGREWLAEHGLTGVEFVHHCSHDYPMWGLALAGTLVRAYRGTPKSVTLRVISPEEDALLTAALEALGLDVPFDKYGWKLASLWG